MLDVDRGRYFGTDQTLSSGESGVNRLRFSLSREALRRLDRASIPQTYTRPFTQGLGKFLETAMTAEGLVAVGLVAASGANPLGSRRGLLVEAVAYWKLPKAECDWRQAHHRGNVAVMKLEEEFDLVLKALPQNGEYLLGIGGVWGHVSSEISNHRKCPTNS